MFFFGREGNMDVIVDQCARAVVFALQRFSCPLIIAGHSAGGHLAVSPLLLCVCACVRACVRAYVRVCVRV